MVSKRILKYRRGKMNLARVKKLAAKLYEKVEEHIEVDQELLDVAIKKIEKRIVTLAKDMRTSDMGLLMGPRTNLVQAQKMHTSLMRIWEEEYGTTTRRVTRGYNEVADWIEENFQDMGFAAEMTSINKDMLVALQNQAVLDFAAIGEQAQRRIVSSLYNSVAAQAPYADLLDEIRGALVGHKDVRGRPLSSYANIYARDAMHNFYNSVHINKARDLGLRWMLYVGDVMGTTRDFCKKRAGKVYSIAQINSWNHNWTGKRGNALIYRGGWNCRHHWQGVMRDWLD